MMMVILPADPRENNRDEKWSMVTPTKNGFQLSHTKISAQAWMWTISLSICLFHCPQTSKHSHCIYSVCEESEDDCSSSQSQSVRKPKPPNLPLLCFLCCYCSICVCVYTCVCVCVRAWVCMCVCECARLCKWERVHGCVSVNYKLASTNSI